MAPRLTVLLLVLLAAPGALAAQAFDLPRRGTRAAGELPAPAQDIKPPWGLWANRAPYPFYNGPFGIDCDDDLIARDIWFDFAADMWLTGNHFRGAAMQARARFGLFFADVGYTQLARMRHHDYLDAGRVEDWAHVTDARGHLGVTIPIPHLGYADFGLGLAGFDETPGLSRGGVSFRTSLSIYPVWPLELEAGLSRAQFFDGTGVNDFFARAQVQVFRHLFVSAGWRWMNADGSRFATHGFTFGLSFQFSNLRTFFWDPMQGPAW
ncbi:MAG: hypothetical protein HS108_02100 [Planctomycetes bacterium]|nr:hypothetical protein [Planctomycetota bacterium]MCL4730380.1 hypothetical protein [Planctomycetota bacterium]